MAARQKSRDLLRSLLGPPPRRTVRMRTIEEMFKEQMDFLENSYDRILSSQIREAENILVPERIFVPTAELMCVVKDMLSADCIRNAWFTGILMENVEKMARSAVVFLSYARSLLDRGEEDSSMNQIIQMLREKKESGAEEFTTLVLDFYSYYSTLPVANPSSIQLYLCDQDQKRAEIKDVSTMRTVMRGLLYFFNLIGILPSGWRRHRDPTTKHVWEAILRVEKQSTAVTIEKYPLSSLDLADLQLESEKGAETPVEMQSWLYGLLLAGTGLRPKSNRVPTAMVIRDEVNDGNNGEQGAQEAGNSDDSDFLMDDIQGNDDEFFDDEYHNDYNYLDPREIIADEVDVYRVGAKTGDPSIRLFVQIRIKTRALFVPQKFGFHHPTSTGRGEDWSPSVALALTLLCVNAGTVIAEDVYSTEKAPPREGMEILISKCDNPELKDIPLLRAPGSPDVLTKEPLRNPQSMIDTLLQSLKLPQEAFSFESLRDGYAERFLTSLSLWIPNDELISYSSTRNYLFLDGYDKLLLKTYMGKRCYQRRYNLNGTNSVINRRNRTKKPVDVYRKGVKPTDWLRARYKNLACIKKKSATYHFYSAEDAREEHKRTLMKTSPNERRAVAKARELSAEKAAERGRLLTYIAYHKALSEDTNTPDDVEEIKQFFCNRPIVDVKEAVIAYCNLNGIEQQRDVVPFKWTVIHPPRDVA